MFGMYYLYYILGIIMIPGILLGIWAQSKIYSAFNKYNRVDTKHGRPANQIARFMLDSAGYTDTKVVPVKGELTDNFNPTTNTVSLSSAVYNNSTVAAVGVCAHEIGHVFQHKQKYAPIKLRNALVPVMNIAGYFVWPLIIIGLFLELGFMFSGANILIYIGIGIYALNTVFCLITLPIELNASKRAYNMLIATGEMDQQEAEGVKKVLNAAAWTYIAALITSALSLLRLLAFVFAIRGKD